MPCSFCRSSDLSGVVPGGACGSRVGCSQTKSEHTAIDGPDTLAINGGPPFVPLGPPVWPLPNEAVREALEAAYASGEWGRYEGRHGARLREYMAARLDGAEVQLCCSGTFAVELALRALQVGPGDEVILAGYDFPGNFRAIEDVGALPVLVDVEAGSWRLDPTLVEAAVGSRTRAIIASHLHGDLADMPRLRAIANRHELSLVEDACQCPGATIAGRPAGIWGDCGVWSFGGSKLLTAGRGGAMFTPRAEVAQRAKIYCERGNNAFPLSELQAAVLLPQLIALDEQNARRALAAHWINEGIHTLDGLELPMSPTVGGEPAYYKLGLRYEMSQWGDTSADRFAEMVRAEGVALDRGFRGFVRRPASRCRRVGDLTHSAVAAKQTLVLHHPVLLQGNEAAPQVIGALEKVRRHLLNQRSC